MADTFDPNAASPAIRTIDRWARQASEDLVRTLDRRTFLKRAGSGAFLFLAALATGQALANPRRAAAARPRATPHCAPPGPYCNYEGGSPPAPDSCYGGHCYQHVFAGHLLNCREDYSYYQVGCWTTASTGGYWTCCDCVCGQPTVTTCGCAQFSAQPGPLPMRGN